MSKPSIHPTALIAEGVTIGKGVQIGPGCIIEKDVYIGEGTTIANYVSIKTHVTLGKHNYIGSFSTLGESPQDLKHDPKQTVRLVIGDNNQVREYCSIHAGSSCSSKLTNIGSNNYFMCYTHVAHDCQIGNSNIFANNVALGGHVQVGNNSVFGAHAKVAQFGSVGSNCMIGTSTGLHGSVPSYWLVSGVRSRAYGINRVGMKRMGMSNAQINNIKKAFRIAYRLESLQKRCSAIATECDPGPEITELLDSINKMGEKDIVPLIKKSKA